MDSDGVVYVNLLPVVLGIAIGFLRLSKDLLSGNILETAGPSCWIGVYLHELNDCQSVGLPTTRIPGS
jgi:hypothetical protein